MKKKDECVSNISCCFTYFVFMVNAVTDSIIALKATFDIYVNDVKYQGENPPLVIEGRTYLPLRAIGEVLGIDVEWNQGLRRVEVTRPSGGRNNTERRNSRLHLQDMILYQKSGK